VRLGVDRGLLAITQPHQACESEVDFVVDLPDWMPRRYLVRHRFVQGFVHVQTPMLKISTFRKLRNFSNFQKAAPPV
jgi:hypothetical protein